jgi:integrase
MTQDELSDDTAMLRLPGSRTKNGLPHDVPLPPLARQIIKGVKAVPGGSNNLIFTTTGRTPVSGFSKIKKRLDAAMLELARKERGEEATLPPWKLHDLRRTASTGMSGIGILPHVVEATLNHVSGAKAGVAGTYNQEMYEPEKRAALLRWSVHISGIVSGRKSNVESIAVKRGRAR